MFFLIVLFKLIQGFHTFYRISIKCDLSLSGLKKITVI